MSGEPGDIRDVASVLHWLCKVQGVNISDQVAPTAPSLSIVPPLLVAPTSYACVVQVVGRISWVHYPGQLSREQRAVLALVVILLPVYAVSGRGKVR